MKHIQDKLIQPSENTTLIRYMDKWYDSFLYDGLSFASVAIQEDKNDGTSWTNDGLGRFMNNDKGNSYRENCYISCWKIQDNPTVEDFKQYCKSKEADSGYAIKVSSNSLISLIKSKCSCDRENLFYNNYYVVFGKATYYDINCVNPDRKYSELGSREIEAFFKDLNYEDENEFRIYLFPKCSAVVSNSGDCSLIDRKTGAPKVIFMIDSKWTEYVCYNLTIFIYDKEKEHITQLPPVMNAGIDRTYSK